MPWDTRDTMSLRREFILLAMHEGANRRELCRRFGISPKTACKWLARYAKDSERLQDRSRRPLHSPSRTAPGLEAVVLALRRQAPRLGWAQDQQALGEAWVHRCSGTEYCHLHPASSRANQRGGRHLFPAHDDRRSVAVQFGIGRVRTYQYQERSTHTH